MKKGRCNVSAPLLLAVLVVVVALSAVLAAPPDYDEELGMYQPWPQRGVRAAAPSLRLRFGKRVGSGGWAISQRSMPSLRLRFGKRTPSWGPQDLDSLRAEALGEPHGSEAQELGSEAQEAYPRMLEGLRGAVEQNEALKRTGLERMPGLRLRFGKREVASEGTELNDEKSTSV